MALDYDVLSRRGCDRLFAAAASPTPTASGNPYGQPPPLENSRFHGSSATAELAVTPQLCPGHFDGYPGLPVAITGSAMTTLTELLLNRHHPTARWYWPPTSSKPSRSPGPDRT